jgi:NADH:ubiquinone oxidoreductase subunit 6 (subunit J)
MQIIFAVVLLMLTALSISIRAAHSSNSYPNAVDIRNTITTTKIIGITLTTHRITTDYFFRNKITSVIKSKFSEKKMGNRVIFV